MTASFAPATSMASPPHAERLGSYEVLAELAQGGMARVALARSLAAAGPLFVVKSPHRHLATHEAHAALVDEARLAGAIRDAHVVPVCELGFHDGTPFVVMPYVEGVSLAELRSVLAERRRAVDVPVAMRIALDALAGLAAAHALVGVDGALVGVVHQDVSPHNLIVGSDGVTRVTDFGIADVGPTPRGGAPLRGKLGYLAPERLSGVTASVTADVYAMAVVLWELVTGLRYRDEAGGAPRSAPRAREVGALHVGAALDDALAAALASDPAKRTATAREFAAALRATGAPVARAADVSRFVESLFAPRFAAIERAVRARVGDFEATRLFAASGLAVSRTAAMRPAFGSLGVPLTAPSFAAPPVPVRSRGGPLVVALVAAGLAVGLGVATLALGPWRAPLAAAAAAFSP